MDSTSNSVDPRQRRRLVTEIKSALRALRTQLAQLNRQVGVRLDLKEVDLDCLDLINAAGPVSPSVLARRAGLHPATMTGVLDRLERAGWIVRERASDDRRAVTVRSLPDRTGEVYTLLSGMNTALDELCADYSPAELALLADFIARVAGASGQATTALTD